MTEECVLNDRELLASVVEEWQRTRYYVFASSRELEEGYLIRPGEFGGGALAQLLNAYYAVESETTFDEYQSQVQRINRTAHPVSNVFASLYPRYYRVVPLD